MSSVWWHVPRIEAATYWPTWADSLDPGTCSVLRAPWPTWTSRTASRSAPLLWFCYFPEWTPAGWAALQSSPATYNNRGVFFCNANEVAHSLLEFSQWAHLRYFFFRLPFFLLVETCRIRVAGGGGLWTFGAGEQWFKCCLQNKKRFKF